MAQKPEIQYVGRFYVHGSEARALEADAQKKEKKAAEPQVTYVRKRQIRLDVTAAAGILMAAVMLVSLVASTLSMQTACQELEEARAYVYELEAVNLSLRSRFYQQYNVMDLYADAVELGLVPQSEVKTVKITPNVPEIEEETWLDEVIWSVRHMFTA